MIERIGIVGGGQLGRMMVPPAQELGFQVTVVETSRDAPAVQVGAELIRAPINDEEAIERLVEQSDVTTWEIEHIPANKLAELQDAGHNIQADPATLLIIQDKLIQSEYLSTVGIPVAPFSETLDESQFLGNGPYVIKSRKGGFDGRGNLVVDSLDDSRISEKFGDTDIYVQEKLEFEKELAVIAARDCQGNIVVYPVVETVHEDNICHTVTSPAQVAAPIHKKAEELARETLRHLNGAGVFAIEMFLVNGELIVNEIAPRVHNSGHLTIEASKTSQFEQHVRAITGLPLGSTEQTAPAAVMVNILGSRTGPIDRSGIDRIASEPDTKLHLYGKTPRLARKIGHITTLAATVEEARQIAQRSRNYLHNL
jgi:phosphoribosylaminoimidazole carboxylase PurK protein